MRGVRRASVFLGLGVNAARNPQFKDYQLQNLALFRIMPDALPDETIAHFKENFEEWVISCALRELTESACNIVSVKVQSTSKPALRPMERSGIGLSAGRRPLQEPETGLVGARPQLDNGGVKI